MLRTNHKRKSKEQKRLIPSSNLTFNLTCPYLPPMVTPIRWGRFSFNPAIHSQTILEIQKLNYLFSCLRDHGLQVALVYLSPENYEAVRDCLEINMETNRQ